jgi:hypothetical protein
MEKRLKQAQEHRFDWTSVCSPEMLSFLDSHASSIGVPKEFLFFPLLTTIASLLGKNTHLQINSAWKEPAFLWLIIASKKGTNKSGALKLFTQALQELEKEMTTPEDDEQENGDEDRTQLLIDQFSFEELFSGIKGSMSNTCFNISGFTHPYYVIEVLHRDDHDGFNERQFDIPTEVDFYYDDLRTNIPDNVPTFKDILHYIMDTHRRPKTYGFSANAMKEFIAYHDELNERKRTTSDSDLRGMLSKAKGQMVRIAMILHAAHHSLLVLTSPTTSALPHVPLEVSADSLKQAKILMDHFLSIKSILRPPTQRPVIPVAESDKNPETEKIKKILTLIKDNSISPSLVARKRWCTPIHGKYTVQSALQVLERMESFGLGSVREVVHPHNSKRSKIFVRHRFEDLTEEALQFLNSIDVSEKDLPPCE